MTLELLRTLTPYVLGLLTLIWAIIVFVSRKTFATKAEVTEVRRDVDDLKNKVDALPNASDFHSLTLQLAEMRGDLKEHRAALEPVNHLSKLLLEDRLNEDK